LSGELRLFAGRGTDARRNGGDGATGACREPDAGTVLVVGGAAVGGMIHIRVRGPAAGAGPVAATAVVVVVWGRATLVVDVGAVEVVDEVDDVEDVDEVVVDGAERVVVVAGAEVTVDDVVGVWARAGPATRAVTVIDVTRSPTQCKERRAAIEGLLVSVLARRWRALA
jgi:hypothetical protein